MAVGLVAIWAGALFSEKSEYGFGTVQGRDPIGLEAQISYRSALV